MDTQHRDRGFRRLFYRRYVSTLKAPPGDSQRCDVTSRWAHWKWEYLPLFRAIERSAPILELGCGTGDMLRFLASHGFTHLQGIDVSEEQLRIAAAHGLAVQQADAFDFLSESPRQYAVILAIDFVEHFTRDELVPLFEKVRDALAPGGLFIVQTVNGQGLLSGQVIYGDLTHMTILAPSALAQLLRVTGFQDIRFRETGPRPTALSGCIRLVLWALLRLVLNAVRKIESGKTQDLWTENMICCCRSTSS